MSSLLEATEVPEEFLRDPSYWVKAEELEHFLGELLRRTWSTPTSQILTTMAQSCVESRSWGVLDSVLRMMNSPAEVFTQPERFLSYFIAPAPPVASLERFEAGLAFDLPLSSDQYPLVTRFMGASLEMIPVFMGLPAAHCSWEGLRLSLSWDVNQKSIFEGAQTERQLSPVLARDLLQNLQPKIEPQFKGPLAEMQLGAELRTPNGALSNESLTQNLQANEATIDVTARPVVAVNTALDAQLDIEHLRHQIARLSDYMIRAQQIITLMASAKKISPEVKEAMRRVDWPLVQSQFPVTVEECYQIFRQSQSLSGPRSATSHANNRPFKNQEEPHV